MTLSWVRTTAISSSYNVGQVLLGRLNPGQTYVRVHFRWGVYGDTPAIFDLQSVSASLITLGLVTTIGDATEIAPNARSASGDAAPPTQRWIYWETRQVQPQVISSGANLITWRDSGSTEPTQTHGQVLATGFVGPDTLNLWASWAAPFTWPTEGVAQVWLGASVLYKTP